MEKLRHMEFLWQEISRNPDDYESPSWHEKALADTEQRLAEGKEQVLDWEAAKKALRKQSQ